MKKQGFDLESSIPTIEELLDTPTLNYSPDWGPVNPETASRYGYSNPDIISMDEQGNLRLPEGQESNVPTKPPPLPDPAFEEARWGADGQGGCEDAAIGPLFQEGNLRDDTSSPLAALRESVANRVHGDSRLEQAITEWSSCMENEGYSFANPTEPMSAPWTTPLSKKEIATAIADAGCKAQVDFFGTLDRIEAEAEAAVIANNRPLLEKTRQENLQLVDRAQDVLAGD
jgi:hypothetical protein